MVLQAEATLLRQTEYDIADYEGKDGTLSITAYEKTVSLEWRDAYGRKLYLVFPRDEWLELALPVGEQEHGATG